METSTGRSCKQDANPEDMTSDEMVQALVELARSKKAGDILIIDIREVSDVADYFLICTGWSTVQVKAIADEVREKMKHTGNAPWHVEGYESLKWVLLDFVDVIMHVFDPETRDFYRLERIWADAKMTRLKDE